ncbi:MULTISPECIES: hypothetical protein [unclassified Campylobacter]|uniref:hypothetical protein n=1 Tax=unclassified Campylobacter TaxID=2593542 RepID=UPI003D32DDA4
MKYKKAIYGNRARQSLRIKVINAIKLRILADTRKEYLSHTADEIIARFFNECDLISDDDKAYIKELESLN